MTKTSNQNSDLYVEEPSQEPLVSGHAFKAMLEGIDPSTKIPQLLADYKAAKSVSKRDELIKRIKYLNGLKNTGLDADEAYVIHNLPIIPPKLRPATVMSGNRIEFADVNNLYKDHMTVNNALKNTVDILPADMLTKEREDAYNGIKAVIGLGEAISPSSRGRMKGLLRQVSGVTGPKTGFFHNKILSKKQDHSGRATIYAEPNLGMNEAAVPTDMLWTLYKFHILRDLSKQGYDYVNSEKAWTERTPAATNSFNKSIKSIPVILNRAPTLMKGNMTAMFPVPIKGNAMGINPIHLPLFSGDFDGDAESIFVPMTPEAISEAKEKLLPKTQIFDYRKGPGNSMMAPAHEAILGSVHMTDPDKSQKPVTFKSEADALAALKAGTVSENTPIIIEGK